MGDLENIFLQFCDSIKKGSTTATDKTLKKICTDCKIYTSQFNQNIVDIQFRKHIGNAKKDVNFQEFLAFIDGSMAQKYGELKKMSQQDAAKEIKAKIINSAPKSHGATILSTDDATARLTDVSKYTGAHKERFDAETGKGKGIDGREYLVDDKTASGYVSGYKNKDTYDTKH